MQKLLTVVIPCNHCEATLSRAVDSVLRGGSDMEILLVVEGIQKDDTLLIAQKYQETHPDTCRVLKLDHAGYGDAIMAGLECAEGLYFKVLNGKDRLGITAFPAVMEHLRLLNASQKNVDLFLANFVYDYSGDRNRYVASYGSAVPEGVIFTWDQVSHFRHTQNILMHAITYRTQVLRKSGMDLSGLAHFADLVYAYQPMLRVEKMYYINVNHYHEFISSNEEYNHETIMLSHADRLLQVCRLLENVDISRIANQRKKQYMINYMEMVCAVASILLLHSGTQENLVKKQKLWSDMKQNHPALHNKLTKRIVGATISGTVRPGPRLIQAACKASWRIIGYH